MRQQLEESYVAVKFAKEADPQMIPLPGGYAPADAAMTPVVRMDGIPKHLLCEELGFGNRNFILSFPVPDVAARTATHSILKRAPPTQQQSAQRQPPGPPAGYPPELSSDEEEEDEDYYGGFYFLFLFNNSNFRREHLIIATSCSWCAFQ